MSRPLRGVFIGEVHEGIFGPADLERWRKVLWARNGLLTRVEVGPVPQRHTDTQRAYYWAACVGAMHDWSGQDKDQCHDHLKEEVLRPMLGRKLHLPLPDGAYINSKPSTKGLSIEEMIEYIHACKEFLWNKHNVLVPDIDHVSMR